MRFGAPVRVVPDTSGCRWTPDAWHRGVGVSHLGRDEMRELAVGSLCKDDAIIEVDRLDEVSSLDRYTFTTRFYVDIREIVTSERTDGSVETRVRASVTGIGSGRTAM